MQESGKGGGGNVDIIFDATLIQAAGNRNKLNTERNRHREKVEELGRNVKAPAMKLRLREGESESLRADASSYNGKRHRSSGQQPNLSCLLCLADMEVAVATSLLALTGTLTPESLTYFSSDISMRLTPASTLTYPTPEGSVAA